jgi:hypothetical protein
VGIVIAVVAVVVVLAVVAVVVMRSRRRPDSVPAPVRASPISPAAPMVGLENALDQVTDRSGRPMREKIEHGTAIDDLIIPDDTGPVLRRALDHVEHADHGAPQPAGDQPPAPDAPPA